LILLWDIFPRKEEQDLHLAIHRACPHFTPMTNDTHNDLPPLSDDHVSVFQLDGQPVRGRAVNLGQALDKALGTDRYPEPVARLLGEAMMIGAIVARALKFDGRLVVQCYGTNDGAVSLLMADCTTDGNIRGYARWNADKLKEITLDSRNPGADALLGGGTFSMTIDQGPDMDQYQGIAEIEGARLSDCAEHYFKQSEQIPTRIRLACGQVSVPGQAPSWRGGGMMIQRVAGDTARGDTEDSWATSKALFDTITDEELIDPDLSQNALLYRLFHESGVRLIETAPVTAKCPCSRARLEETFKSFDKKAIEDMVEDGLITANCEFCASEYVFKLSEI